MRLIFPFPLGPRPGLERNRDRIYAGGGKHIKTDEQRVDIFLQIYAHALDLQEVGGGKFQACVPVDLSERIGELRATAGLDQPGKSRRRFDLYDQIRCFFIRALGKLGIKDLGSVLFEHF